MLIELALAQLALDHAVLWIFRKKTSMVELEACSARFLASGFGQRARNLGTNERMTMDVEYG